MTTSHAPNMAGRRLSNRYVLLSLIAQGGMGEVWKARDAVTGSLVAAKVLRPELTGDEISLSRLRLEAKNAMRARHPNIAAVLDAGEDDHQGWIIMELVEGSPLTRYVGDGNRLSEAELIPLLVQTAYALDAAARAGVVHRDIKPANIIVRADGKVKLTDFGVSFSDGQANLTAAGMVMGTAQYLPPEQALGKPATPVGDLYALGVIAFEALAGYRPYTGKTQVDVAFAHVNEDIPALPIDASQPMAELIYRLLSKDPTGRPQTGAALARELAGVAALIGVGTDPMPLVGLDSSDAPVVVPAPVSSLQGGPTTEPTVAPSHAAQAVPPVPPGPPVPPVHHVTRTHLPPSPAAPAPGEQRWRPVRAEAEARSPKTSITPAARRSAEPSEESRGGAWVIVGLIALTLVLIVIAMVTKTPSSQPSSAPARDDAGAASQSLQIQEVDPWLVPILDF